MKALHYVQQIALFTPDSNRDVGDLESSQLERTPCRTLECVLETNIELIPLEHLQPLNLLTGRQDIIRERSLAFGEERMHHHITYPLSHAVDQRLDTSFRSPTGEYHNLC